MIRRTSKLLFVTVFQIAILCSFTMGTMAEDSSSSLEGKIIGGSRAYISDFPHAVYIRLACSSDKGSTTLCGSSVLNQLILLTAGHCLQCAETLEVTAFAGCDNWHKARNSGTVRKSLGIKLHSQFSLQTLANDIGLVLLSKQLRLGNNIKRVIINIRFPRLTNRTKTYVAGWGNIKEIPKTERDKWLKSVEVPLVSANVCTHWIGEDNIYPGMMCAGTAKHNAGRPAGGDSGSALITSNYRQLGIVSWRTGPLSAKLVYTNVTYFYPWIKKEAKQLYCEKRKLF